MRLLITGAGGFIGSALARVAVEAGHAVTALARTQQPWRLTAFTEKPTTGDTWINGGFFVFEPGISTICRSMNPACWSGRRLRRWRAMASSLRSGIRGSGSGIDTAKDVETVNRQWHAGAAPWKKWRSAGAAQ